MVLLTLIFMNGPPFLGFSCFFSFRKTEKDTEMKSIFKSRRKRKEGGTLKAVDEQYGSNLILNDQLIDRMMRVDSSKDLIRFLKDFDMRNVETFSFLCGKHRRKYPHLWTNKIFNIYF